MEEMLGQKTITNYYNTMQSFYMPCRFDIYRDAETCQAFLYLHINSTKFVKIVVEKI
jgi:hypothetical protein